MIVSTQEDLLSQNVSKYCLLIRRLRNRANDFPFTKRLTCIFSIYKKSSILLGLWTELFSFISLFLLSDTLNETNELEFSHVVFMELILFIYLFILKTNLFSKENDIKECMNIKKLYKLEL